jgi:hypothetical protein
MPDVAPMLDVIMTDLSGMMEGEKREKRERSCILKV